ncbi:MAG: GOLPH3/VPS74 family protein [Omnitrophica WOR_2 bacterium]
MFTLSESLFLLTLSENHGTIDTSAKGKFYYGLSGSILDELILLGKAQINPDRRLTIADAAMTGDRTLDSALRRLEDIDHPRKATYWVKSVLNRPKKLQKQIYNCLVSDGILSQEEDEYRWVIPSQAFPNCNAAAKYCLKESLRAIVLTNQETDLRNLALLSLLDASNHLRLVFTKDERREAKQRIHELMLSEALKNPAAEAIEEVQSAVASLSAG